MPCEKCKVNHPGTYGSGRFCSVTCARSYAQSKVTEKGALVRDQALTDTGRRNALRARGVPGRKWNEEQKEAHSTVMARVMASEAIREKISASNRGRVVSSETRSKISNSIQEKVARGEWAGWSQRGILQESYAEKFWRGVLTDYAVEYKQEVKIEARISGKPNINHYFLDFLIEVNGRKINLEIDGSQHSTRSETDSIRDTFISGIGYEIYRITWINPNTVLNQKKVRTQVLDLLEFIGKQ